MVASFIVASGMGAMAAGMPDRYMYDGHMPGWSGNDYFVGSVAAVVFPDKGAAGKRDCHYGSYDGNY
jgi:hypothetical protein